LCVYGYTGTLRHYSGARRAKVQCIHAEARGAGLKPAWCLLIICMQNSLSAQAEASLSFTMVHMIT
jgi:hypothetical protein